MTIKRYTGGPAMQNTTPNTPAHAIELEGAFEHYAVPELLTLLKEVMAGRLRIPAEDFIQLVRILNER